MKFSSILVLAAAIVVLACLGFHEIFAQSPAPRFVPADPSGERTKNLAPSPMAPSAYRGQKLNAYQLNTLRNFLAGSPALEDTIAAIGIQVQFADSLMGGQEGSRREAVHDSLFFANQLKHIDQYFKGASRDRLAVRWDVTGKIYNLPEPMGYYGDDRLQDDRAIEMMSSVIDSADDDVDFSRYHTVMLIHAGAGQETDIADDSREQLWSSLYASDDINRAFPDSMVFGLITNDSLGGEPFFVSNFMLLPEDASQDGVTIGSLGIWAFEMGSRLGLLPLFDSTPDGVPDSRGVGDYDLMSSGLFNVVIDAGLRLRPGFVPGFPCAFNRVVAGWVDPLIVKNDGLYRLRDINSPAPGDTACLKIPVSENEYFLVVNRVHDTNFDSLFTFTDLDSNFFPDNADSLGGAEFDFFLTGTTNPFAVLPDPDFGGAPRFFAHTGSGVYVWHVDENVIRQTIATGFLPNDFVSRKGVDLEEADGIQDLDATSGPFSTGSHFDSFRESNNARFGPGTKPSSVAHSGAPTGIRITDISNPATVMTCRVEVSRPYEETRTRWASSGIFQPPSVVDLDGQGGLEIVVLTDTANVYVFKSDGTEFLDQDANPATIDPYVTAPGARWVGPPAFGDIDGGGDDEIIATDEGGAVYAWKGDGSEVVDGDGDPGTTGVLYFGEPLAAPPMLLDINEDGINEIVIVERYPDTLEVGFVNGSGEKSIPSGAGFQIVWPAKIQAQYCAPLAFGAVGGKGDNTESVVVSWVDTIRATYGLSNFPVRYRGTPSGFSSEPLTVKPQGALRASFPPTSPPVVGDLDHNGLDEVVLVLPDNRLLVLNRSLLFAPDSPDESVRIVGLRSERPSAPALGDVDGNGTLEIALWDDEYFYLYEHNARLHTNWPQPPRQTELGDFPPLTFERILVSPLIMDADGDGRVDIVCPTAEGTLFGFDASGNRLSHFSHPIPDGSAASSTISDLDGDGELSLVVLGNVSSIATIDAVSDTIVTSDAMVLSIQSLPGSTADDEVFWSAYQHDNLRLGRVTEINPLETTGSLIEPGSFIIYPNPVKGAQVHARVLLNRRASVKVEIFNLEGQRAVFEQVLGNAEDVIQTPFDEVIDVGHLKSGIYMMRLVVDSPGGSDSIVKTFAILR
ncbi:MAG: T9SS type A sorting domain-containing protein [Candidatus Latescibacterota bacterium]|nr:MAG: T9SS type A sorting domain-containing protein [Candidatus Latescibacterota bacterium]